MSEISTQKHDEEPQLIDQAEIKIYPYHIIEFVRRGKKPAQRCIEIVASKWILFKADKGYTLYPPVEETDQYENFLQSSRNPPNTWKYTRMIVIDRAVSYNQALEKVERLNTDKSALTCESEEETNDAEKRITNDLIRQQLLNEAAQNQKAFEDKKTKVIKPKDSSLKSSEPKTSSKSSVSYDSKHFSKVPKSTVKNKENSIPSLNKSSLTTNEAQISSTPSLLTVSTREALIQKKQTVNKPSSFDTLSASSKKSHVESLSLEDFMTKMIAYIADIIVDVKIIKSDVSSLKSEVQFLKSLLSSKLQVPQKFIGTVDQLKQKYGFDIPIVDMSKFLEFDSEISKQESLRIDLNNILQTGLNSDYSISQSLVTMFKMIITKEVAGQFVAIRSTKGKQAILTTNFFHLCEVLIMNQRENAKLQTRKGEIHLKLTQVMSNVKGWPDTKKKEKTNSKAEVLVTLNLPVINESDLVSQPQTLPDYAIESSDSYESPHDADKEDDDD